MHVDRWYVLVVPVASLVLLPRGGRSRLDALLLPLAAAPRGVFLSSLLLVTALLSTGVVAEVLVENIGNVHIDHLLGCWLIGRTTAAAAER